MKQKNIFDLVLDIILILLGVLITFWLLQLLFGGSPGLSEFNFAVIVMVVGFLAKIYRELGEIKMSLKFSFEKIKNQMEETKKELSGLKHKTRSTN